MSLERVSYRYAKALIDLAEERNILETVENDIKLFLSTCKSSRELVLLFKNPIILHDKKEVILDKIFDSKVNELTLQFFKIISRKGRESILVDIAKSFENQALVKRGVVRASLKTATELPKEQKESILSMLSKSVGQKIEIEEKIDQDLIGGFVIKVGDRQIDNSIKSDLIKMKKKFNDSTYISKL